MGMTLSKVRSPVIIMKNLPVFLLILLCNFPPLFAQTVGSPSVYIQPVTGGSQEDNLYITNLLTLEIQAYNIIISNTAAIADYTFAAALSPEASQPAGNPAGIYNLHVTLRDNRIREIISEQHMLFSASNKDMLNSFFHFLIVRMIAVIAPPDTVFNQNVRSGAEALDIDKIMDTVNQAIREAHERETAARDAAIDRAVREANERETAERNTVVRESVRDAFSAAVDEVIAAKPPPEEPEEPKQEGEPVDPDRWRNGNWYLAGTIAWSPRVYVGEFESVFLPNVCFSITVEFHFLNRFSFEAGGSFTADWVVLDPSGAVNYRDLMLEIPLSFKYSFKPSAHFLLQPYLGVILNLSLYGTIKPPPVALMAGFEYGVQAGPGVFYIDPRFSMDITKTRLNEVYGRIAEFDRIKVYVGFGYKFRLD